MSVESSIKSLAIKFTVAFFVVFHKNPILKRIKNNKKHICRLWRWQGRKKPVQSDDWVWNDLMSHLHVLCVRSETSTRLSARSCVLEEWLWRWRWKEGEGFFCWILLTSSLLLQNVWEPLELKIFDKAQNAGRSLSLWKPIHKEQKPVRPRGLVSSPQEPAGVAPLGPSPSRLFCWFLFLLFILSVILFLTFNSVLLFWSFRRCRLWWTVQSSRC